MKLVYGIGELSLIVAGLLGGLMCLLELVGNFYSNSGSPWLALGLLVAFWCAGLTARIMRRKLGKAKINNLIQNEFIYFCFCSMVVLFYLKTYVPLLKLDIYNSELINGTIDTVVSNSLIHFMLMMGLLLIFGFIIRYFQNKGRLSKQLTANELNKITLAIVPILVLGSIIMSVPQTKLAVQQVIDYLVTLLNGKFSLIKNLIVGSPFLYYITVNFIGSDLITRLGNYNNRE